MRNNPIIIIGAGRSGTSTLISLLDASPDIYMAAEASFFLPKLWQAIYEIPSESIFLKKGMEELEGYEGITLPELIERKHEFHTQYDEVLKGEREKSLEFAREICFRILGCDTRSFKRWGFKEIWNGHPRTNHEWAIYNEIFDKAQWIHCIRHPFDFVKSIARWHSLPLTKDFMLNELNNWVAMVNKNREQAATERYLELRLNDLATNATDSVNRIFDFVGLPVCDSSLETAGNRINASSADRDWPQLDYNRLRGVPHLIELMEELEFELPCSVVTSQRIGQHFTHRVAIPRERLKRVPFVHYLVRRLRKALMKPKGHA